MECLARFHGWLSHLEGIADDQITRPVISAEIDDRLAHFVRSAMIGHDDVPMPQRDPDRDCQFLLVVIGLAGMAMVLGSTDGSRHAPAWLSPSSCS